MLRRCWKVLGILALLPESLPVTVDGNSRAGRTQRREMSVCKIAV